MQTIVLDLETEKDFKAVGGKQNMHLLGVTVVGTYNYGNDSFYAYEKEEFSELEQILKSSSLVVGFNINHFDLPVLAPHVGFDVSILTVLDLMLDVEKALGFRVSLDNLSRATLGVGKSGMGLEAIEWWQAGEKQKVKDYCIQDVRLTRDLYEFGKKEGYVLADTRDRGRMRVSVAWREVTPSIKKILAEALEKRRAVEFEYIAEEVPAFAVASRKPLITKHKVDVHAIKVDSMEGYCHLRQAEKTFALEKIKGAILTEESYHLQHDVQQSLI